MPPRPQVVPLGSVPVIPAEEAPTRVRIARLVTRERCGSNLLLGACWMDPGEETNVWSFEAEDRTGEEDKWYGPVDETYFVVRGRLGSPGTRVSSRSALTTGSISRPAGATACGT